MASVHSVARRAVINLGDSGEEEDAAFSELKSFRIGSYAAGLKLDLSSKYNKRDSQELQDILENRILSQPWFTRARGFQELLLSCDPRVQCVSNGLKWRDLCQLSSLIK
jgi:hypothetical protein